MSKVGDKRKTIQKMTSMQMVKRIQQLSGVRTLKLYLGETVPLDLKVELRLVEDEIINRASKKVTSVL